MAARGWGWRRLLVSAAALLAIVVLLLAASVSVSPFCCTQIKVPSLLQPPPDDDGRTYSSSQLRLRQLLYHQPPAMWNPSALVRAGAATTLALTALPHASSATLLYVTSYAGTLTTLNLTLPASNASTGSLQAIASNNGCATSPSWLTLDHPKSVLYCLDEGLDRPNGTLSSYRTSANGTLVQLDKVDTLSGPVSAVIYGDGGKGLALAE